MNSWRRVMVAACAAAALVAGVSGQGRGLKVLVLYDMEGTSGIVDPRQTIFAPGEPYISGRASLTADVNAAVAGLKAAGVTDIVVVDGHGSGNAAEPDIFEKQLLAPARMISRSGPFDIYMDSYDQSVDAIVAVAMHAGAGNRSGFIAHTYTGVDLEYRVNGVPFNETMILAAGAARMRIPVIAVSGDDQLEKELRRFMPWAQLAAGKHAVDRTTAEAFPRDEVDRRISSGAKTAVEQLASARLLEFPGPYRFALTFQDEAQARNVALLPGAEVLPNGTTVQMRANDFEEGYRLTLRMMQLAGAVARETAYLAVTAAAPDADARRAAASDYGFNRFLMKLPPPPPAAAAAPLRYFGAR
jgi:D-amino peptidase